MVKILMVDDDVDLCKLISTRLKKENYRVVTLHDGLGAKRYIDNEQYDLIILDVMLPGCDGFSLLNHIRTSSNTPIVMLTAKGEENDKVFGLRSGADDYLTKPFSINELVERIRSILRRCKVFNESLEDEKRTITYEGILICSKKRMVCVNNHSIDLTPTEFDILFFMASYSGQVFTKKQIYEKVWGQEYNYDDNNIAAHIKRLRSKLGDEQNFIQTIWGVGYKFQGK